MSKQGFAKVVVRSANTEPSLASQSIDFAATTVTEMLQRRQTQTFVSDPSESLELNENGKSSSGLTPIEVGLTLAVLFGLFLVFVIVGELCKVFNKPRKEAAPYSVQQKPYQPSAAGYGTRAATNAGGGQMLKPPSANAKFGSRSSLLNHASPMGYTGSGDDTTADTSLETPSAGSHGTSGDYFGSKTSSGNGHTRGQSSGVQLPGATIASSRKPGGAHPALNGSATVAVGPDGAGFTPGQPVSYSGYAGPAPSIPRGPGGAPQNLPSHARVGLGRPPAADAHRRSRYSRAASRRIDSVGPGQLRKSMYMGADDDPMNSELYGANRRSRLVRKVSGDDRQEDGRSNLRRVDSVGKGDARRKSQIQSTHRASRAVSVYNASLFNASNGNLAPGGKMHSSPEKLPYGAASTAAAAAAASRGDPLGARNPNADFSAMSNANLLAPQLRSRSGSGSSNGNLGGGGSSSSADMPYHSSRSPGSYASPLPQNGGGGAGYATMSRGPVGGGGSAYGSSPTSPGGFQPGSLVTANLGYSSQAPSATSPTSPMGAGSGYPGGGAPRIRPTNQGFSAYHSPVQAAGGYDRGGRQVM